MKIYHGGDVVGDGKMLNNSDSSNINNCVYNSESPCRHKLYTSEDCIVCAMIAISTEIRELRRELKRLLGRELPLMRKK